MKPKRRFYSILHYIKMFWDLDSFHGYCFQLLGDTFHYNVLGVARLGAVRAVIVVGLMGFVRRGR